MTINTHAQLLEVLHNYTPAEGYVAHGSRNPVKAGDVLQPRRSTRPCADPQGRPVLWGDYPPFVFAVELEHVEVAVFNATVKSHAPLYGAGVRVDGDGVGLRQVTFLAEDEVKESTARDEPVGTLCLLGAGRFKASPSGNWLELVSPEPEPVLAAYRVSYRALGFDVQTLEPLFPVALG